MTTQSPSFLASVSLDAFFSSYWEKQPLHIQRGVSEAQPLITLEDVEALLSSQPVYFPGVQLTQSGRSLDANDYVDESNCVLPLRLFEQHSQGATIVLSQAQKLFKPLSDLCEEVMRTLQMRCQTNVYISPPANQGFNAHYDTHDVFILQVSGAKTFNFYPSSVELPCPDEQFDASALTSSEIDESVDLSAGDTLYIPRGVVHDAVAHSTSPSIHITLGVYPILMRDLLQETIQTLSESDSRFRHSIDRYLHSATDPSQNLLRDAMVSLMHEAISSIDKNHVVQSAHNRLKDELALNATQNCEGLATRVNSLLNLAEPLTESSFESIRLRQNMIISYEHSPSFLKIRTFGQVIELQKPIAQVVGKLLEQGQVSRQDLQVLHDEQQMALITRLTRENLIELVS